MKLSKRLEGMQESPIRKLIPLADKAKKDGKKVYHLNIGQPDIETPDVFLESIKAYDSKVVSYSTSQGDPKLIEAMIDYYKTIGAEYEKDEILIMNGGSEAILFSLIGIADPGDNILVPEPFYTNYNGFSLPIGVDIKPITTHAENGFKLPGYAEMESLVDSKTRAILLSNPGNPTGAVYSKDEIARLSKLAKEKNIYIIADEVYREFIYDDLEYTSFAVQTEIADRVIIVDSISKRFSACGARIGSIASKNKELIKGILKLCMSRLCVPTLEQIGATELYKLPSSYFAPIKDEYQRRRDIVYSELKSAPGVILEEPKGAFYVIAKLPVDSAEKFVIWMLEEFSVDNETVMSAPAENFYASKGIGTDEVRIAYVLNTDDLKKAMHILKEGLKAYPGRK